MRFRLDFAYSQVRLVSRHCEQVGWMASHLLCRLRQGTQARETRVLASAVRLGVIDGSGSGMAGKGAICTAE